MARAVNGSVTKRSVRPDAGQLAWFEGLLRAIADASPEELDAGRWTKRVATSQGPMRFQLALPDLVDDALLRLNPGDNGGARISLLMVTIR